jgi:hypothetical protein
LYTSGYHLGVVEWRKIIWNVEHDVAYDASNGRKSLGGDVFKRVLVDGRIFGSTCINGSDFKRYPLPPIYLIYVRI